MTIPRPRRHCSTSRPWKSPRQTILLSPGFVNELKLWYKNYARTAPLPEVTASASDEGDYYDITKMFTTNASAATDGPEVASLVDRPAAISYRSSPASHRKPSLQMSGKSLRIIDDCPVLIVQLMRTARKMPTLIIAPDGYIPNSVIRQWIKVRSAIPGDGSTRKRRAVKSFEESTSKGEQIGGGGGGSEQTEPSESHSASLKEERRRVLRDAIAAERELKRQQESHVEASEFRQQFEMEGRESPDDDSRPKCEYPPEYEELASGESGLPSRPPSKAKVKHYWSKMRHEVRRKSTRLAEARMQAIVPSTETELYSLAMDTVMKRMSSRTLSLRTIDRSIHQDEKARRQLRKALGGSEEKTKRFLADTTSPAGFIVYLTEILGDRGKALELLEEAIEGSVTAYDELVRLLPDAGQLTKILSTHEAARKESILIMAPNVLFLPHLSHFLQTTQHYNLGRADVASLLAGKWTPPDQPDTNDFQYTETLHLRLEEMTDFLTAYMANDVDKLRAMPAVLPANLRRAMKESDIADRFGQPDLLMNLNKKIQIADLVENPVEAVALSCSFNRENLFNDWKPPSLPTPLVNFIDRLLQNWKWRCAWDALNTLDKRAPIADVKSIECLIHRASKLISLLEGNIRSITANHMEPSDITQIIRQAIYGHPNYVLKLDELVGAKKRAFFLRGIHRALGSILMRLVQVILSGVPIKAVQDLLATLAEIIVNPITKAFLDTWKNLVQILVEKYGDQIALREAERKREFELAQELIDLVREAQDRQITMSQTISEEPQPPPPLTPEKPLPVSPSRRASKSVSKTSKSKTETGGFTLGNVRAKVYTGQRISQTRRGQTTPRESPVTTMSTDGRTSEGSGSETLPPELSMSLTEEQFDLRLETPSDHGRPLATETTVEERAEEEMKRMEYQQKSTFKITPTATVSLPYGKQAIEPVVSKITLSKRPKQAQLKEEQVVSSSAQEPHSQLRKSSTSLRDSTTEESTEDALRRMNSSPWSGPSGYFSNRDRRDSEESNALSPPVEDEAPNLEVADSRYSEVSFDQTGGRSQSIASRSSTLTAEEQGSRRRKEAFRARAKEEEDEELGRDKIREDEELQEAESKLLAAHRDSLASWETEAALRRYEGQDRTGISMAAEGGQEDGAGARRWAEGATETTPKDSIYPMVDKELEVTKKDRRDEEGVREYRGRRKLKDLESLPGSFGLAGSKQKKKKDAVGLVSTSSIPGPLQQTKSPTETGRSPLHVTNIVGQPQKTHKIRALFTTRKAAARLVMKTPLPDDDEIDQDDLKVELERLARYTAYHSQATLAPDDFLKVLPISAERSLKAKPDTPEKAPPKETSLLKKKSTQSDELLHSLEVKPHKRTSKRLIILGKVQKTSTETTSSLSSVIESTSSDHSEIPQLHYFRPLESEVEEETPKEIQKKDPITLALLDTIMKCLAVFGSYSQREMEAIAPRIFNCQYESQPLESVPKCSIFSEDPDCAYWDLFCFQVLDTIRAGVSIEASGEYLLKITDGLLRGFSSLGCLGLAPPQDIKLAVQRKRQLQRQADDEAQTEAATSSTTAELIKWSDAKRRSELGSEWFDEPSSDSGTTLLDNIPARKPMTRQPEFWAHIREKQMIRKQRILEKLKQVETAQRIEDQTSKNIVRLLTKTASAARKWEPGSEARRLLRSRVQNPYFEPLKGKPALLDDLIERINAYGNYVNRLVRRRVQRSLSKCGFREKLPPTKVVSINNYRIIPRPSNIPSQEWRRLIGRGERIAYTTTDTGLCHRANVTLAPIIKLDNDPDLSGHLLRNLDIVNIIHAGTHSDNILRQTYLNA